MKRTLLECPHCHKLISKSNFNRHLTSHEMHPEYQASLKTRQTVDHDGLNCKYCGKLCKNKNSLAQHECRCSENPNRIKLNNLGGGNAGIKAMQAINKQRGHAWNKGLTKNTDNRVAKYSATIQKLHDDGKFDYSKNKHTDATKEKIRQQKLELCAKQGTNLCGKGLRGYYKGFYCQSSWELAYVIYQLEHNIDIKRNTKGFKYTLDGIERSYFPDFYEVAANTYIEIKGYYDRKTKEKEKQFPKNEKLIIFREKEMKPILDYVISKYGKDFTKLYVKN